VGKIEMNERGGRKRDLENRGVVVVGRSGISEKIPSKNDLFATWLHKKKRLMFENLFKSPAKATIEWCEVRIITVSAYAM
jgi:hypothetical protein